VFLSIKEVQFWLGVEIQSPKDIINLSLSSKSDSSRHHSAHAALPGRCCAGHSKELVLPSIWWPFLASGSSHFPSTIVMSDRVRIWKNSLHWFNIFNSLSLSRRFWNQWMRNMSFSRAGFGIQWFGQDTWILALYMKSHKEVIHPDSIPFECWWIFIQYKLLWSWDQL